MTGTPTIAQRGAYTVEVVEGRHYVWCACGRSTRQPYCDGSSHNGSGLAPVVFQATKTGKMWLCGCKHSNKGHLCDGTHSSLPQS